MRVPVSQRGGEMIEPRVSAQWYVLVLFCSWSVLFCSVLFCSDLFIDRAHLAGPVTSRRMTVMLFSPIR